jgi:N utilization substance protein B
MEARQPNISLQKKTAARMAAVQSLYKFTMNGDILTPAKQVLLLKKQLTGNRDEQKLQVGAAVEPNYKLVETLLGGVEEWAVKIDSRMQEVLNEQWKRERMSPVLVAILRCGIFEMFFARDMSPKIVIDEYASLTRHFFEEPEVHFVHAALSRLARKYTDALGNVEGIAEGDAPSDAPLDE